MGNHEYFNNTTFTRDDKTGYYLCTTKNEDGVRKRLHVYVWEFYNGPVPKGYHVHHKDKNKQNNHISNLEIKEKSEHSRYHARTRTKEQRDKNRQNMIEKVLPKAIEWHKSGNGREWHKLHYEQMKNRLHIERKFTCLFCGKEFNNTNTESKFCSNNCKSAYRRKSGVDNIIKTCEKCGKEYISNKYTKTKYCGVCKCKKNT